MKKLICALTILALCAMSVTAFAANPITGITAGINTDSTDVIGTYVAGSSSDDVFSINIAWGNMTFTYTAGNEGTWNPSTHAFDGTTTGAWACATDANKITVTNHSNAAIDAALSYTAEAEYSVITGAFAENSGTENDNMLELATAIGTTVEEAPTASAVLTLSGALASGVTSTKIGAITVTISEAA